MENIKTTILNRASFGSTYPNISAMSQAISVTTSISKLIKLILLAFNGVFDFCSIPIIYIFFAGSVNNFAKFAKKGGGGNGIGN